MNFLFTLNFVFFLFTFYLLEKIENDQCQNERRQADEISNEIYVG